MIFALVGSLLYSFLFQSQLCFCPLPFYFHLSSNSVLPFVKLTLVPRSLVSSCFILVTVVLCLVLHFISLTSLCPEFLALHCPCVSPLVTLSVHIVSGCLVRHDFEPWFCVSLCFSISWHFNTVIQVPICFWIFRLIIIKFSFWVYCCFLYSVFSSHISISQLEVVKIKNGGLGGALRDQVEAEMDRGWLYEWESKIETGRRVLIFKVSRMVADWPEEGDDRRWWLD